MRKYYVDNSNTVHSFANDDEYRKYIKIHGNNGNLEKKTEAKAIVIAESTLTQEQKKVQIRKKYDKEIKKICNSNLFNDINSARNLSLIEDSPLQEIAKKITDWELKQQVIFVKILNDVENGIITIDKSTFDDNFIEFNKNLK